MLVSVLVACLLQASLPPTQLGGCALGNGGSQANSWTPVLLCAVHESIKAHVNIPCIDYWASQVALREGITNADMGVVHDFLSSPRPSWSRVRWINIDGLSWDVIQVS